MTTHWLMLHLTHQWRPIRVCSWCVNQSQSSINQPNTFSTKLDSVYTGQWNTITLVEGEYWYTRRYSLQKTSVVWLDHESDLVKPSPFSLLLEVNIASQVGLGHLLGVRQADTEEFHCQLGSHTRALRCACNRLLHRAPSRDPYLSPVGECLWRRPCCWPWVSSTGCWGEKAGGGVPIQLWWSLYSAIFRGLRGEHCSVFRPGRCRAAGACDGPLWKPAVEERKSSGGATLLVWNG